MPPLAKPTNEGIIPYRTGRAQRLLDAVHSPLLPAHRALVPLDHHTILWITIRNRYRLSFNVKRQPR